MAAGFAACDAVYGTQKDPTGQKRASVLYYSHVKEA